VEKQRVVKYRTVLPPLGGGDGRKDGRSLVQKDPNVSGKVTNGPRHGSAAVAATRARASYVSHADDSPSSDENWSSYDELTDLR